MNCKRCGGSNCSHMLAERWSRSVVGGLAPLEIKHACNVGAKDTMQRADVVAILRGLAQKFQDERDKVRAEQKKHNFDSEYAIRYRGQGDALHHCIGDIRKLADEIEQGAK